MFTQSRTRYEYDRVFPQHSTQEEVFEAVQPLCVSVLGMLHYLCFQFSMMPGIGFCLVQLQYS